MTTPDDEETFARERLENALLIVQGYLPGGSIAGAPLPPVARDHARLRVTSALPGGAAL